MVTLKGLIEDIDSKVDQATRDAVVADDPWLHHSFGMWVRNTYKFWEENSDYYQLFYELYGLTHADDMWGITQGLYKEYLTGVEYDLWPDVHKYKEHWKKYG